MENAKEGPKVELVITIDEKLYEIIKNPEKLNTMYHASKCAEAVRNGTLLPKGHGALKDADACKKNKKGFCEKSTRTNWYDIIDDLLDDAPTIIEADKKSYNSDGWCNTCEYKHLESECLGCAKYDEYDNLIALTNYKAEEESN